MGIFMLVTQHAGCGFAALWDYISISKCMLKIEDKKCTRFLTLIT
jgi:hypothetical protein